MSCKIPDDLKFEEAALRLHIRQTAVKVYVENKLVYEYGYDRLYKHKTIGSGFQFINCLDKYKGKRLKISLYVAEENAFSKFDSIDIYEWDHAYRALLTENRLPMFLGSFLTIFGLSVTLIAVVALLFSIKYARMLCLGAFSICMGLWTLCYYNVILIYSMPLYTISFVEYMVLYLSPIPILIYMYEYVKELENKNIKIVYWILFTIQMCFNVITIYLHTIDKVHCAASLKYMQILIIFHLIFYVFVLIMNIKKGRINTKSYIIGLLVVVGCIGYDMASYYVNRYWAGTMSLKGVSAIGIMVFLYLLILEFYRNMSKQMMEETERNSLIRSAYTDELTHLPNRRFCSEEMQKINNNKDATYTVVSFDLNNLKKVNDTYGHSQGDLLIQSAAEVIRDTFSEYGIVGRMGGDEFIAILNSSKEQEINCIIERFYENIKEKNCMYKEFVLSISCGYAISHELEEKNVEKLYQMADNRMYENKKRYKEKRNRE